MTFTHRLTLVAALTTLFAASGCSTTTMQEMNAALPWNKQEALELKRATTPTRIATIWSHDVLTGPSHTPTQGFGGRLYFYNNQQQAVSAGGKLVVYAFNDTDAKTPGHIASEQADRKYVFTAEEFAQHYSESEIGPSYSVWLPWQPVGGPQQHVTLIAVLVTEDGKQIVGQPSRATLPGRAQPGDRQITMDNGQLQGMPEMNNAPTTHTNNADQVQREKRTTTLPLSRNLTRHLNTAPPVNTPVHQQASGQTPAYNPVLPRTTSESRAVTNRPSPNPQTTQRRQGPAVPNAATIQRYQRQQSADFQSRGYPVPASAPAQQAAYPAQYPLSR